MTVPAMAAEVFFADAVPTTVGSTPGYTANLNPLNTPARTGLLAPPQSPAGTSVTSTGRTQTATSQAVNGKGHSLGGWNGVRTPTNPV